MISADDMMGKEGLALWKNNFAPSSDEDKVINVPAEWANFISSALLAPDNFERVKALLQSGVWQYIIEGSDSTMLKPFVIPESFNNHQGSLSQVMNNQEDAIVKGKTSSTPQPQDKAKEKAILSASTSAAMEHKKRKDLTPLVESQVRRSDRIQLDNQGYKRNSCPDRNCLACSPIPPPISGRVVRNLSVSFCNMDPKTTTVEILQAKKKKNKVPVEPTRRSQRKVAALKN